MNSYKNILLINFGGIGDEILFLSVMQSLRKTYPDSKITLCLESRSAAFLCLTKLPVFYFFADIKTKNKYFELAKLYFRALSGRYDLVISSGSNPLISILLFMTGIKTRIGYNTNIISKKLLTYAVDLNKNQYAAKMYFDLARPVTNCEFEIPSINVELYNKIPNSVLIHPGVSKMSISKNIIKTVSPEKWAELIKLLLKKGKKVYLAGGQDDKDIIMKITDELKNEDLTGFTNMYGKTENISDLVKLIKQCEVLVCSDSAPMHIGIAVNSKTIAFFGPTDNKKLMPEGENFYAITNSAPCRPCLWDKRQSTCKELKCLDIDINKIVDLITTKKDFVL